MRLQPANFHVGEAHLAAALRSAKPTPLISTPFGIGKREQARNPLIPVLLPLASCPGLLVVIEESRAVTIAECRDYVNEHS